MKIKQAKDILNDQSQRKDYDLFQNSLKDREREIDEMDNDRKKFADQLLKREEKLRKQREERQQNAFKKNEEQDGSGDGVLGKRGHGDYTKGVDTLYDKVLEKKHDDSEKSRKEIIRSRLCSVKVKWNVGIGKTYNAL